MSSTAIAQRQSERIDAALSGEILAEVAIPTQDQKGHALPRDLLEAALRDAARAQQLVRTRTRLRARVSDVTATETPQRAKSLADDEGTTSHSLQAIASTGVKILERWDGVVLDVDEDTFVARLLDERTGRPRAEAAIFIDEVSPHDRSLLKQGAIFYWHIGYRDPDGDRERISRIRFRRLPPKTKADLNRAEREATEIRRQFGWH